MKDNVIKLNESDVLTLKIQTQDGIDTGEVLTFDLEDIELLLKYQEMVETDKKNKMQFKNQLTIIDKRQDVKGKKLLSRNEEDKIKATRDFIKKEAEVYNMFLGENGVEKLLNGRKLTWSSLQEIDKIIETQILPYLNLDMKRITDKIKTRYGETSETGEMLDELS